MTEENENKARVELISLEDMEHKFGVQHKPKKPSSPKQKAVLLYGQRLRGLGSVTELQRHLRALGYMRSADAVGRAAQVLRVAATTEYEKKRKELDPEWKEPWSRMLEEILAEDAEERLKKEESRNG